MDLALRCAELELAPLLLLLLGSHGRRGNILFVLRPVQPLPSQPTKLAPGGLPGHAAFLCHHQNKPGQVFCLEIESIRNGMVPHGKKSDHPVVFRGTNSSEIAFSLDEAEWPGDGRLQSMRQSKRCG